MQRIVPNLWFDHKAVEAVEFYTHVFPDATITETIHYPTEGLLDFQKEFAGDVLYVEFAIRGYRFIAINAGPDVTVNPSISFMLNFDPTSDPDARQHLDTLWNALSEGGETLMPLDDYGFSSRYGWIKDKYGITWQLLLTNPDGEPRPFIVPSLMFTELVLNRASEAIDYYASVFGGHVGTVARYPEDAGPTAGTVMYGDFEILGQWLAAMDSGGAEHGFTFTFGVSLMVECADQAELDRYWSQLSSVPDAEQCGWCADKFGVSWQLVPANLAELMSKPGSYEKLMNMKKIEVAAFG
jgi:predicted 3-demethylubiquinone-9 3-methyltransferase (glyoxalase superfamily)